MKIGPVDPEIAWLNLKKETEGKIYSPVGNVAERLKNVYNWGIPVLLGQRPVVQRLQHDSSHLPRVLDGRTPLARYSPVCINTTQIWFDLAGCLTNLRGHLHQVYLFIHRASQEMESIQMTV